MSHPKEPAPVCFFIALTTQDFSIGEQALTPLTSELGGVIFSSEAFDFSSFTHYYEKEMGRNLKKRFYFFENLKSPDFLVELKHICYKIELSYTTEFGKRKVNLDPGYVELSKVVLSTFKDYAHRIYLGRGVFAEVTLIYKDKSFISLPWTYPDYQAFIPVFNQVREIYKVLKRGLYADRPFWKENRVSQDLCNR